jgi:hypothetical protein
MFSRDVNAAKNLPTDPKIDFRRRSCAHFPFVAAVYLAAFATRSTLSLWFMA